MRARLVRLEPAVMQPSDELAQLVNERLGREAAVDRDEVVLSVVPDEVREVGRRLRDDLGFDYLRCLSAVDYVDAIEVVYHLFSIDHHRKLVLKTRLVDEPPTVDSLVPIWRGADWHEREAADLFGIVFRDHPHPVRLLLADGFDGFPLRKSYPLPPLPTPDVEEEE